MAGEPAISPPDPEITGADNDATTAESDESTGEDDDRLPPCRNEGDSGSNDGDESWFVRNNPLYLFSVVMMLAGLYLVNTEAGSGGMDLDSVLMFFGIQNLYEIIMVGMALYLLTAKIQPRHGKLLLIFVLVFLADLTFYQVRISVMSSFAGNLATTLYLFLAAVKLAAVIKILRITVYWDRLFYALAAFGLIWFSPKFLYRAIDAVGQNGVPFEGHLEVYRIWVAAALIHLPVIVVNLWRSGLEDKKPHALLDDETPFYRWLLMVPFFLLPFQLIQNVMNDASAAVGRAIALTPNILPWLLVAAFFVQVLYRRAIEEHVGINLFDGMVLIFLGGLALGTESATEVFRFPYLLNRAMIIIALTATWFTRGNIISGIVLCSAGCWWFGAQLLSGAQSAVTYGKSLSRRTWASLLMLGSFLLLGLGFVVSLKTSGKRPESSL